MSAYDVRFPDLYRCAYQAGYRLLGDRASAEDIAQETLARTYLRWDRVQDHARAWVVRVATNLSLDVIRRRQRLGSLTDGEHVVHDPQLERRADLIRALQALPKRQREVVVLRYLGDFSEAETAAALGVGVGTVKQHGARARIALRRALDLGAEIATPKPVTES